jgi:hypothetical protein
MYFWTLNSNMFPEFLYHPYFSRCIGLCESTSVHCSFCLTSISGVKAQSTHTVWYPNLPPAMRPVPHIAELPVPKPPTNMILSDSVSSDEGVGQANNNMDCDPTFAGACSSNEPHLLTQRDLNYTWGQIPAKVIRLNISEESFCLFHEHIKYYFAHLNSSASLKPCLIEKFCIHIWPQHKMYC